MVFMANHPSGKSYSAATIRTYASAIKSVVLESGIMPASMPGRLSSQVRAGVQALHHGASRTRLPLTIGVLEEIYPCFDQSKRIDRVTFAIISTGVHGLFRLGELCPTTLEQEFFPRRADYSVVEEDGVALSRIFLHRSKTDKLHQGISVSVPHNSRTTSAHRALVKLFLEPAPNRVLTLTSDPLFPDSGNRPILRTFLIKRLRAAIARVGRNPAHYAGHSLRKGGAQSLFDAGVDMRDIACVGRWVQGSNAVRLYRSVSATAQARWVEHAASLPPTGRSRQLAFSELRQEATAAARSAAQKGDPAPDVVLSSSDSDSD